MQMLTNADEDFLLIALAIGEVFATGPRTKTALKLVGLGLVFRSFTRPDYFWLTRKGLEVGRAVDKEKRKALAGYALRGGF